MKFGKFEISFLGLVFVLGIFYLIVESLVPLFACK